MPPSPTAARTQALTVCGEEKNADEIMATVLRDKPFYDRSGGGLTLSGGEPFMNPDLALALLRGAHERGIHTAVETCLHVPWKYIEPALPYIDLFLADLKHVDAGPLSSGPTARRSACWTTSSVLRTRRNR